MAADPGKVSARIAAVQITLHDLQDDRPQVTVLLLNTAPILRDKPLEMMK
jgi:hypothetical protein